MNQNPTSPGSPARRERLAPQSWALWSYRVATTLARPAAGPFLRLRERRGKEDGARRSERFGISSLARPPGVLVWLHAASVGETMAILPLLTALRAARPDLEILLTTGTVTSAQLAAARLPTGARHQFVPLDSSRYAKRFLDHWRPDMAILTEQEIWPNHILECRRRGIPLALVNARMSTRSYVRWRRRTHLARELFGQFDIVLAQNEPLAQRLRNLGAPTVLAVGNLKVDAPPLPINQVELGRLRSEIGERPHWLAASTHAGEERIIAQTHLALRDHLPGLVTLIAPRHPERGPLIASELAEMGANVALRSRGERIGAATDIYIADSIGELGTFYSLAPLAFIGGSLVDKGGQNPIEAIRHCAAVVTGPYFASFQEAYETLLAAGGVVPVSDGRDLRTMVADLLGNRAELAAVCRRAEMALETMSGALARSIDALLPLLPRLEEPARAPG